GIHLDARVVGDRRQPTGHRGLAGLGERVGLEGGLLLDQLSPGSDLIDGHQLEADALLAEDGLDLPHLVGVAAADDDLHGVLARVRASLCRAKSCWAPIFASSTSLPYSSDEKGSLSAVPWISTNLPVSVSTKLKSTSAAESSW